MFAKIYLIILIVSLFSVNMIPVKRMESHSVYKHGGKIATWKNYISYIIHRMVYNNSGEYNELTLIDIVQCHQPTLLHHCEETDASVRNLTTPCSLLSHTLKNAASRKWHILVYQGFALNITILKSYTPFNDTCTPHSVDIYEGLEATHGTLIDRFCGLVTMETVYTKYHRALLKLQALRDIWLYDISIQAKFEIISQEMYFRYNSYNINPNIMKMNINVKPSFTLSLHGSIKHYWYVSNSVFSYTEPESYTPTISMAYAYLTIEYCISTRNTSYIVIYHGLVSHYQTQWRVNPQAIVHCNITKKTQIPLNMHMYATVILDISRQDEIIAINMTFYYNSHVQTENIITNEVGYYTSESLVGINSLKYGHLSADYATLEVTDFHYVGDVSTIRADSVITDNDTAWSDGIISLKSAEKMLTKDGKWDANTDFTV